MGRIEGWKAFSASVHLFWTHLGGFFRVVGPFALLQTVAGLAAALFALWIAQGANLLASDSWETALDRLRPVLGPLAGALVVRLLVGIVLLGLAATAGIRYSEALLRGEHLGLRASLKASGRPFTRTTAVMVLAVLMGLVLLGPGLAVMLSSALVQNDPDVPAVSESLRAGGFLYAAGLAIALYLTVAFAPTFSVVVVEGRGAIASFRRAWELTRGSRGGVALSLLLFGATVGTANVVAYAVAYAVGWATGPVATVVPAATFTTLSVLLRGIVFFLAVGLGCALAVQLHERLVTSAAQPEGRAPPEAGAPVEPPP